MDKNHCLGQEGQQDMVNDQRCFCNIDFTYNTWQGALNGPVCLDLLKGTVSQDLQPFFLLKRFNVGPI